MIARSKLPLQKNRVRQAASSVVEGLEPRAYLSTVTGVVLGSPVNTTASSVGISPIFANLADFNGDGKADLFVANSSANSVTVLTGNGDGSFSGTPDTVPVAGSPYPLATGDMNGDGHLDIVAGTIGSPGDISIILNDGTGHFGAATNIPALGSNHAIGLGAFVNGGPLDIIDVSNNASNVNNAAIVIGNGSGGATSVTPFSLPFGTVAAVGVGDFNHDGNLDFVVVNQVNNSVSVFLGNGTGTFQAPKTYPTGSSPTSMVVDDFNGDGNLDLVTADSTGGAVSFLAGKPDGSFAAPVNSVVGGVAKGGGPLKVRDTTFTTDGHKDLVVLLSPGSSGDATVMLGNGDGTFHTGTIINTMGGTRNAIAAGDLNGDGFTDVVLTNSTQVTALINITNQDMTPPTAAVDATQAAGNPLSPTYDFTVMYSDNTEVDAASLNNNNLMVTFPNGTTTQAATLVSTNVGNAASIDVTYSITFPANLSSADNGTYTVGLGTTPATDANSNALASISPNTFALAVAASGMDTSPPTASVDTTQVPGSTMSSLYNFTVTYTDNVAVNASTLGNGNLVVTFPNNLTQAATFVSSQATGPSVQATYQISFPSNLTTADIGSYPISINANSVKDMAGNAAAAGNIGSLNLIVSATQPPLSPTGDFVPGAPFGKIVTAAVAGVTRQNGVRVTVTNGSSAPITGTLTITLYTSNTLVVDSSATALTFITHKVKKLKSGKGFLVVFKPFKYPSTVGMDHLVANVQLNGVADSYDGATSGTVNVAAPFTDVKAVLATPNKLTIVAGKKVPVTLNVQNLGNIPFVGTPTVDVFASVSGALDGTQLQIASGLPVHLNFRPGQSRNLHLNFLPSATPPTGGYHLILTINVTGDTNTANNSVTSTAMVSF